MNISYRNSPGVGFDVKGQMYGKDPHWISVSTKASYLPIARSQNSVKLCNFNHILSNSF